MRGPPCIPTKRPARPKPTKANPSNVAASPTRTKRDPAAVLAITLMFSNDKIGDKPSAPEDLTLHSASCRTPAITGREQAAKPAVAAQVHCVVGRPYTLHSYVCMHASASNSTKCHRITSSACTSTDSGTLIPSVVAVFRFSTRSNFVGCSTGRSPGFAPLRMLSTYLAARRNRSPKSAE